MKKLLEVLQYGETDIRFNTDIDVIKMPDQVLSVTSLAAITMMTKLWGGNEASVIAMIRALTIADLAVSVNTEEMLEKLKESAMNLKSCINEARGRLEKDGGKVLLFNPLFHPGDVKN